jgi:hypothetical protein
MIDENNALIIDMGMAIRVPYTDPTNPTNVTDITGGTQRRLILPQGTCGKVRNYSIRGTLLFVRYCCLPNFFLYN